VDAELQFCRYLQLIRSLRGEFDKGYAMKTAGQLAVLAAWAFFTLSSLASGNQGSVGTHSPHGNLNVPCQNCHTAEGWKPIRAVPEFNHDQTSYPLRGMHQNVACTQCHVKPVFSNVGKRCQDCHADIHKRQLGANCEQCHTVRGWGVAIKDIQAHNNRFPLTGAHAAVDCDSCHKNAANSKFQIMSTMCYSCHEADYKNTATMPSAPNHLGSSAFPVTCDQCHSTDNWLNAKFDHSTVGFPLTGGHAVPPRACTDCHSNNNYNLKGTTCISCHQKDFNGTTNPNHVAGGFSTSCQECHTTIAWQPATFDHSKSSFPLTGSHTVPPRQCADCHINNNYNITNTLCISCHQNDFKGAVSPVPHAGFPTNCEQCHDTAHWTDGKFDHSTTGFTLTGAHMDPPRVCTDCHVNNNYTLNSTACYSCHQKDYVGAKNPDHVAGGFAQTCELCHSTSAWQPATFDHSKSAFPLTGSHTVPPRQCADCHINNNYNITNITCISCHQNDYNGAKSPVPHTGFPTTCEQCHDTIQWTDGKFDHSQTGWALTGSHTVPPRACTDCHVNNNYNLNNTLCITCHQTDFQNAKSPVPHTGFPTTCEQCHDTIQWTDGKFDHSQTGWPLTGSHTVPPRACTDCHINNNYNLNNTLCITCHQTDFQNAKSPVPHTGFPTTCEQCHDTIQWTDGKFDHSQTGWPLTGSHTVPPRACTDCHINNNYNITVTTCISCHQTDFQNANSPVPHTGFPTTCELCHDTIAWTDATFNHNNTPFPLTGSHTVPPRACVDCHVNNNYQTLPTACIGCHQADYNGTTNPGHAAQPQFFPTTCADCHSTTNWLNATFNHAQYTKFSINHGNANGVCSTCHTNSNDYSIFQCTNCHSKSQTDGNHQGVQGYVYNSVNCYQCHSSGSGG